MSTLFQNFQVPLVIVLSLVVLALAVWLVTLAFSSKKGKKHPQKPKQTKPEVTAPPPQEGGEESPEELPEESPEESAEETAEAPAEEPETELEPAEVEAEEAAADIAEAELEAAEEDEAAAEAELEVPESVPSRMGRLRSRLARSGSVGKLLLAVLSRQNLSENDWEEIEETLLMADVGMDATEEIMGKLRTEVKVQGDEADYPRILQSILLEMVDAQMDRSLNIQGADVEESEQADQPQTPKTKSILVVGVNGTGKTTTVGKLARLLRAEDKTVVLGAADTFRAAAAEQLGTWGERVGVDVVKGEKEGADPASVAFEAVKEARQQNADVVIVDTAGRLQNKATLMDELGKVKRVMEKHGPVDEVLLVLDATTGQNGMKQAEVFADAVGVTGIVLTKLDGSAKGGIVVSVQKELGVPVKLVGLGEGPDDLAPFDPRAFVEAIVSD